MPFVTLEKLYPLLASQIFFSLGLHGENDNFFQISRVFLQNFGVTSWNSYALLS